MDEIGATPGIGTNSCTRSQMGMLEAAAEDLGNECRSNVRQ